MSRIEAIEDEVLHVLGQGRMSAGTIAIRVDRELRDVGNALWRLNSRGRVRLVPGSRWEQVTPKEGA